MKKEVYRHKKTGGIYSVICNANIEKTGEPAVVYRNERTGEQWVRPAIEFNDGRFERIDWPHNAPAQVPGGSAAC